jgi:hypothetical protein
MPPRIEGLIADGLHDDEQGLGSLGVTSTIKGSGSERLPSMVAVQQKTGANKPNFAPGAVLAVAPSPST